MIGIIEVVDATLKTPAPSVNALQQATELCARFENILADLDAVVVKAIAQLKGGRCTTR